VAVSPVTILTEASVGILLGLGAAVFVAAAEAAGDTLAVQMGLSGANVLDPLSETQMPVLGQLMGLFVLAMIVSVGGHVVILEALVASLHAVPVGSGFDAAGYLGGAVGLGSLLFLLGLRFAAPVVAAMMIGNAALGVLARTVPQLNVLMVAFPLQIAIGLFTLSVSLPLVATFFSSWPVTYVDVVSELLQGLAPAGGG
jgi:flagellar biosynthetic protein FliR